MVILRIKQAGLLQRLVPSLTAAVLVVLAIYCVGKPSLYLLPSMLLSLLAYSSADELNAILAKMGLGSNPRLVPLSSLLPLLACALGSGQLWIIGGAFFVAMVLPLFFAMRQPKFDTSWLSPLFSLLYLGVPFLILQQMVMPQAPYQAMQMRWQLAFFVVAVKSSDIGGFLVGHYLGKRALAPRISPAKTWEGALGGLLLADILCLLVSWYAPAGAFNAPSSTLCALAVTLAATALGGDLFESYLKRMARLKDSGKIPGMGGVLDLLDSILISTIVFWIFVQAKLF